MLLQPFILLPGKERVVAVCHIDTVAIIEEKNISNKERVGRIQKSGCSGVMKNGYITTLSKALSKLFKDES